MVANLPLRWLLGVVLLAALAAPAQAQRQRTFHPPDHDTNRTFHVDRLVRGPDGEQYRVQGDLHVVLRAERDGNDVGVIGHADAEGITVRQIDGPDAYRAVGSAEVVENVEQPRGQRKSLRTVAEYDLVATGSGDRSDYRLAIALRGVANGEGELTVHVEDVLIRER
jgi:hypothetical protein